MADFRYVAKSMDGKIHRGAMEAAGESALQQLLKEQGMFLITAREGGLGMIRSGEGSGNIDVVMNRLALHYERESRLKQQVQSTMTYPVVLLVMCILVVIVIVTFILPQFEELFSEMESLPGITEFLMAVCGAPYSFYAGNYLKNCVKD